MMFGEAFQLLYENKCEWISRRHNNYDNRWYGGEIYMTPLLVIKKKLINTDGGFVSKIKIVENFTNQFNIETGDMIYVSTFEIDRLAPVECDFEKFDDD